MKFKNPKLYLIIPSRNEEDSIISTLENLDRKVEIPHKIIIVDDSSDNTENLVKKYAKTHKNIELIHGRPNSISFSKAIKVGAKAVDSGVFVVVMADLCDDPSTINLMYKKIIEGWDIVCGSRYVKGGSKKGGPFIQSVLSLLVCLSLHYFTGIPTKDVSNAFKMYRKEILEGVFIGDENGVEISMIITLQAYFKGAKIHDIPTRWVGRTLGQSKFKILQRTPRYSGIYVWAIINSIRRLFHLKSMKYSIKY